MALDNKMTQTIGLRANGDQLLRPMEAFGKAINASIQAIQKLHQTQAVGSKEYQQLLQQEVKTLQKLFGQAKSIQDLMNAGGKRKQSLFGSLDEQTLGKKTLGASKLKLELDKAKTSTEALEIRLVQLNQKFAELGQAGNKIKQVDIAKAMKTEDALRQVRQLEMQLGKLDARAKAKGGLSKDGQLLRADITKAQDQLLSRIQNGRRIDWSKEIAGLQLLTERYRDLDKVEAAKAREAKKRADKQAKDVADAAKKQADAEAREAKRAADKVVSEAERKAKAEKDAAEKRRQAAITTASLNEAQLRADINRGASRFNYTPGQARGFNLGAINTQIDQGVKKLKEFQDRLNAALAAGRPQKEIDRLANGFQRLKNEISEATAKKKAFDSLPENKPSKGMFPNGLAAYATKVGAGVAVGSLAFGALSAARDSAQYVIQLEDAMARLQAISGATDPEIKKLGQSIVDLGGTTRYSTLEIAEAATTIVQAGYSASEAAGVLKSSLMLAAGSGSTVAEGVETMTSSLGAFQLQASEAGRVADILMEGLNQSKLSITQMQAALQYAGATAKETGMSLEELTAIAASLANAGIRNGSTIGTGLRQLIVDLQTPSEKFQKELKSLGLTMADVDIRTHSLATVVKTLTDAGFSAEQAFEGFEVRAASAFLAFRNQIDTYDQIALALTQTGAAAAANEKAMDSLSAKWTQAKNNLGELVSLLAIPFINAAKAALDAVSSFVGGLNDMIGGLGELLGLGGNVGLMLTGTLLPALAGFMIGGPMGAVIGGLFGFIGGLKDASDASEELAAKTDESKQKMAENRQTVQSLDDAIDRLVQRGASLKKNHTELQVEVLNLTGKFEGLASQLDATKLSYEDLMGAMVRYRGLKLEEEGQKARQVILDSANEGAPVIRSLKGNTDRLVTQATNGLKFIAPKFKGGAAVYQKAANYAQGAAGRNYAGLDGQGILQEQVTVRGLINDLRQLGEGNTYVDAIIGTLKDRLQKLEKVGELRGNITQARTTIGMVEEINSEGGQQRDSFLLSTRQKITEGLDANKGKPGSGDRILNQAVNQAEVQLANMRRELAKAPANSSRFRVLQNSINDLQGEVNRVTRASDRATEAMVKGEKAGAGENLDSGQVRNLIENEFKGSKVTSWRKRPYSEQVRLYNNYKAGRGPLAAKPGSSNHGNGNAIDMVPIRGMDIDQVAAFLESKGLEITERLVERNPKNGRVHWHLAWKPKSSRFQKSLDSGEDKAARELEELLQQEAGFGVKNAQARIATIINQGKSGSVPVTELASNMESATAAYKAAKLNEFDVKNPTAGASPTKLKYIANARKALADATDEEIKNYVEQLYRQIQDNASLALQEAIQSAQDAFDQAQYANGAGVRTAESNIRAAGNRTNRFNVGAGTQYRMDRDLEDANLAKDKADVAAMQVQIDATRAAIEKYNVHLKTLKEGSEEYKKALAEREAASRKLTDQLNAQAEAQGRVNDQERKLDTRPLSERLKDAARGWAETSGAMDSWAKRAEDFVGPALDNLTNGMTDFFMSMMDGSKSFKNALGDMLKSFATFVMQYIAKALALAAVKAILKAVGLDLPTPSFEGGEVSVPGKFGGGVSNLGKDYGGRINRGSPKRDSALYNLAEGEYVVRNKSVKDIGIKGMDMINKHGAKGLAKIAGAGGGLQQNIVMPKQETNVFVVQEKGAPPMGPSDILVTIHEDIMQGGATKKLIKQVAQGG